MRALRLCGRLVAAAAPANIGIPPAPSPPLFSPPHTDTFPLLLLDNEICNKARISLQQKPGAATSKHPITHLASQPHPLLTLSPYCETISLFLFDDEICRGGIVLSLNSTLSNYTFFRFPPCLARNCLTMSSAPWQGLLKPAVVP